MAGFVRKAPLDGYLSQHFSNLNFFGQIFFSRVALASLSLVLMRPRRFDFCLLRLAALPRRRHLLLL